MDPEQPRQPKDLDGLLKFCMEATRNEDAPPNYENVLAAMDPERRQWLETALSSMSVDVVDQLAKSIKILLDPCVSDPNASEADIEHVEYAFDCMGEWIDDLDMANNFHKIGGFEALHNCLSSPHATIRSAAANSAAELSQNNPYCQERFVAENFLPRLLDMIVYDQGEGCKVKALYAISCIVRESKVAQEAFLNKHPGAGLLVQAIMESPTGKMRTKACFFVSSLSQENADAKKQFIDSGLPLQLATLLQSEEHSLNHEQMARALLTLLKDEEAVKNQLMSASELGLKSFLRNRIDSLAGKEEFNEEREYLTEINAICYGSHDVQSGVDR